MRFNNLCTKIVAETLRSFVRQPEEHVDSDAKIGGEHNRQRTRCLLDHLALLLRMSSSANDERLTTMHRSAANFSDGVRVTEIDRNVASLHRRLDCIAKVTLCDDLDFPIGPGEVDNRFPHATSRADEEHAHGRVHLFCSNFS